MVPISFFKRKITNADHYLFGQVKTYGTILSFTDFPFLFYIIKGTKEMAVCIVALEYAQNGENLELTALNDWHRRTHSNISTWYPAGHHFSRSVGFPIKIISITFTL